jgi:hypothetical protein
MGNNRLTRLLAILSLAFFIACLVLPGLSMARTEARYELRTGGVVFGNDLYSSNSMQCIFHQQTLNCTDIEVLDIDFPVFDDIPPAKTVLGPTTADDGEISDGAVETDGVSTANVLPFGLVNLAFPSIRETVNQTYSATSTGFYTSNFLGIPPPNEGAYEVTSGPGAFLSPVSPPQELVRNNLPFSEMYDLIPGYERQKGINKTLASQNVSKNQTPSGKNVTGNQTIKNSTLFDRSIVDLPLNGSTIRAQQTGPGTSLVIAGQEVTGLATSVPLTYAGHNVSSELLSYPYFPFAANSSTISNMTLLARLWRNAHLGTMGRAYEGDTSYPIWILPTEYTKSAIAMYNWYKVNDMALNYTLPGMRIMPRFWDLGVANPYSPAYNMIPDIGTINETQAVEPDNNTSNVNKSMQQLFSNAAQDSKLLNASTIVKDLKNITGEGNNISVNYTTGGGSSLFNPPKIQARYMPAGGPAGTGPGWEGVGPHQIGWVGGALSPWVAGPSTNIYFPGRGGPDWPPFYWGFGRYKGW